MKFLQEFKKFALRGNVMDLAIGIIIGAAFGKIVSSLVDGILMPLIGLFLGGVDISEKSFVFKDANIQWGLFLQNILDFTIIAFAIFLIVKFLNRFHIETSIKPSEEVQLLREIRDLLKQDK